MRDRCNDTRENDQYDPCSFSFIFFLCPKSVSMNPWDLVQSNSSHVASAHVLQSWNTKFAAVAGYCQAQGRSHSEVQIDFW